MIRVLIADQIARIVHDLEKLSAFSDVDVCGIARAEDSIVDEAQQHQPDVLLLNDALVGADVTQLIAKLSAVSAHTRVVLLTSSAIQLDDNSTVAEALPTDADTERIIDAIRAAAGAPAGSETASPEATPIQELPVRRPRRANGTRGEVCVVFSGKGGVGKSVIATNVAVALSMDTNARVVLVDLDLQYGDVAVMLHVENHLTSIEDLAQQADQVDGEFLEEVLATGPEEVRALLAPSSPELADLVTTANLRSIFRELSKAFDYIVVDSPAHLEERILEVMETADQILLVSAFNVTAVRSTKVTLKVLQSLGIDAGRLAIILNQTRPKVSFTRADVEEILRFRVLSQMPYEPHIDDSVDNGSPLVISEPRSDMTREFHSLVAFLAPAAPAPVDDNGRPPAHVRHRAAHRRRFSLGRR